MEKIRIQDVCERVGGTTNLSERFENVVGLSLGRREAILAQAAEDVHELERFDPKQIAEIVDMIDGPVEEDDE